MCAASACARFGVGVPSVRRRSVRPTCPVLRASGSPCPPGSHSAARRPASAARCPSSGACHRRSAAVVPDAKAAFQALDFRRPLTRRHLAELPQGRKAARVGELWRVRGGSCRVRGDTDVPQAAAAGLRDFPHLLGSPATEARVPADGAWSRGGEPGIPGTVPLACQERRPASRQRERGPPSPMDPAAECAVRCCRTVLRCCRSCPVMLPLWCCRSRVVAVAASRAGGWGERAPPESERPGR